jgi:hypothetical protein
MSNPNEISPEEFSVLCRALDLTLAPDEAERLREAYAGMRLLLQRLPRSAELFPEPAIIYAHPGTRLAT